MEGEKANELPPPHTDFANDIQRKNEEAQRAMDAADVFATHLLSALPDKCDSNPALIRHQISYRCILL